MLQTEASNRSATTPRALRVAMVCSGLGQLTRGFETSTLRWRSTLAQHTALDVKIFSGGPWPDAQHVWNIPRRNILLKPLAYLPFVPEQNRWELTYGVEQFTFAASLLYPLMKFDPDVVWSKDVPLSHLMHYTRDILHLRFKTVFANGGAFKARSYSMFDHVQQLQPGVYQEGLSHGIPAHKMTLLGNSMQWWCPAPDNRSEVRRQYGYEDDDWIVICVAAWNRYHKRIDYLIEEVASMQDQRVKLILCGVEESDGPALFALGEKLLPGRIKWLTVEPGEVLRLLGAADAFALASLNEGFGNVLIEAAMCGLPIVCHSHPGSRYILGEQFEFADLRQRGGLAEALNGIKENPPDRHNLKNLCETVRSRFGEQAMAQEFETMVHRVVGHTAPLLRK